MRTLARVRDTARHLSVRHREAFVAPEGATLRLDTGGIGEFASECLRREVMTYPKPGLVSHRDSGAHTDMDASLMCRSASALTVYFSALAQAGHAGATMARLREIGILAEKAMMAVTRGVNTHRGAIFGMGLLCAAAGYRNAHDRPDSETLGGIVARQWGNALLRNSVSIQSHGAVVAQRFRVGGARVEAAQGFPAVYEYGLPALADALSRWPGDDEAIRVHVMMRLIQQVDDTNLLHRGGAEGMAFARREATAFLCRGSIGAPDWRRHAERMHRRFVALRLSPGGCADLLAMTLFVNHIEGARHDVLCRSAGGEFESCWS
jgi:triphosphoribosyl-dephospho-CoA synthase